MEVGEASLAASPASAPAPVQTQAATGTVEITVELEALCWDTFADDGSEGNRPLPGAGVILHGHGPPVQTDDNGVARFKDVRVGAIGVSASKADYRTARASVHVHADTTASQTLTVRSTQLACSRPHTRLPSGTPGTNVLAPVFWADEPAMLIVLDRGLEGQRIPAVDDEGDAAYRWRTRVVEVRQASDVTIERIDVQYLDPRWRLKDGQALHVADARDVRIHDCVLSAPRGHSGIRVQDVERALIEGNRVLQDWAQSIAIDGLSAPERRELASWIGRLVFDFGSVHSRTDTYRTFVTHRLQPQHDRRAYRVGFGPADERYWAAHATVLGFSSRPLPTGVDEVRRQLDEGAGSLMQQIQTSWNFATLLPGGTSTARGDLQSSRHVLQHEVQTRRAAMGAALLSESGLSERRSRRRRSPFATLVNRMRATPLLSALRARLVARDRWLVGLGGTGIRVARTAAADVLRGTITVRNNWVENFPVGIDGTWKQEHVGQDDIQRIDITDNSLRLHSPLIPLQRGGIIAGGARRIRVDGNDIDVREGSSHSINRARGWFLGVDGIRVRGRAGAWVGVRDNHVRGCAVGLRTVYNDAPDPIDSSPTRVESFADNAFIGCDFDTL